MTDAPTCPDCKSPMHLIRSRGRDFPDFWGCNHYPKCKGSRSIVKSKLYPEGRPENDFEHDERLAQLARLRRLDREAFWADGHLEFISEAS